MDEQKTLIEEPQSFTDGDISVVQGLVNQLTDNPQPLERSDIENMVTSAATHLYVARDKESKQIIGMVTLVVYRVPDKLKGWVEDLIVHSEYRGMGIATQLMNHVIEEARKYHVRSLNLTSNPKRESANMLYLKLGFEQRETNVYRLTL